MKFCILVIAYFASISLALGQTAGEAHCHDFEGLAHISADYRNNGIPIDMYKSELSKFLDEHPEFPASKKEKDQAMAIIDLVYAHSDLSPDQLGALVYRTCMVSTPSL